MLVDASRAFNSSKKKIVFLEWYLTFLENKIFANKVILSLFITLWWVYMLVDASRAFNSCKKKRLFILRSHDFEKIKYFRI